MAYQHLAAVLTKASIVVMLMGAMPACSDSPSTPTQDPPPPPPPPPVQLAIFTDSDTGFSTSDVRDVQGQIVRFDRANNSLTWAVDGRSLRRAYVVKPPYDAAAS